MFFRKYIPIVLILLFVVFNVSVLLILLSKTGKLESRLASVSNAEMSFNEKAKEAIIKTSAEINLLREIAGMTQTDFPSFEDEEIEETSSSSSTKAEGYEIFYTAFDQLYTQYKKNIDMQRLGSFVLEINNILTKYKLIKEQKDSVLYLFSGNAVFYQLKTGNVSNAPADAASFVLAVFPFKDEFPIKTAADFERTVENTYSVVKSFYSDAASDFAKLKNFVNSEKLKTSFADKGLKIVATQNSENNIKDDIKLYEIVRSNTNKNVSSLYYSYKTKEFYFDEQQGSSIDKITDMLNNIESAVDIRSFEEILAEKSVKDMEKMAQDSSFKMFLESKGVSLSPQAREDVDSYNFDIKFIDNNKNIGAFVVNKYTGDIYLTDSDGIQFSSIKSIYTNQNRDSKVKKKL